MSTLDPPAGWPDIDGIDVDERLLGGPSGPLNRAASGLTARTKQLQEVTDALSDNLGAFSVSLAAPTGAALVGFGPGTVSSFLTALGTSAGAAAIGFTQGTTGAIDMTLQAKARQTVSVADFGATGTGLDESAAIQAALNAGVGRTVVFVPGRTYVINTALQVPSGTTIIATGAIIRRGAAIDNLLRNKSDGTLGTYLAGSDITVIGGLWDANTATFTSVCTVIAFGHAQRIKMQNMRIANDTDYHHIEVNGVNDCEIRGCSFTGGRNRAITTNEAIQIDMNIDGSQFPWFGPADLTPCRNIRIIGNTFTDVGTAIGTHSSSAGIRHVSIQIANNEITGCYYAGVAALNWADVKIISNRFTQGYLAVRAVSGGASASNRQWVIADNTFYDQGNTPLVGTDGGAIFIQADDDGTYGISSIAITGNTFLDITNAKAKTAITINYCSTIAITGNTVRGTRASGVSLYKSVDVAIHGNTVAGTNTGVVASSAGVNLAGPCNRVNITGNTLDTLRVVETTRALVTGNTVDTGPIASGSNVQTTIVNNLVAGVYA